jgi:ketosteroid isomerase-like protein
MSTTDQILELGGRWAEAEQAGDVDALADIADDGFRLVGPFGFVLDKEQWLERYRSGAFRTTRLTWDQVSVADHGDVAISIGLQSQQATYQGRSADGEFRVSHVFALKARGWRLVGMHVSQAAPRHGRRTSGRRSAGKSTVPGGGRERTV